MAKKNIKIPQSLVKLWGRSLDDCYSPLILLLIVGGELLALILTGKGTQEGYD